MRTDDLVLSYSFDGRVVLWALGQNAKLFPSDRLQAQDFLPQVSIVTSANMESLLRQPDFLLNNIEVNPVEPQTEFLITSRSKDSYLIRLEEEVRILKCFDSIDEVRFGKFS